MDEISAGMTGPMTKNRGVGGKFHPYPIPDRNVKSEMLEQVRKHRLIARPFMAAIGVWMVALLASACSEMVTASPLENARTSPEALARAALQAVSAGDTEALAGLMVTRDEYETLLWPSLPDRDYMPFDFVWSLTGPRSRKARTEVLGEYGGFPLELVRVDLGKDVEAYQEFTLFKDARMTVRRVDTGQEGAFPLMDVLVQLGDGWKFLNFVEDI